MAVSFLNTTYCFRGISFGNQREQLLRHGRCAHCAWPAGEATSTWPMMLPYDKGALTHVHAHTHVLAHLLLQLPLPLPLLSLLVSHSIAPLNLKLPQSLSRPFPCPPRNVEQLMLDLVLKNVKQTQQNNKQSKTHRFAPRFISRLPLWNPYLLFFVVIAREPKMLDRFRRGQNKNKQ